MRLVSSCSQSYNDADEPLEEFSSRLGVKFLTYETEFVLFLAVLENSVLPMG